MKYIENSFDTDYLASLVPKDPVISSESFTLEDAIVAHESLDDRWPARSKACGGLPLVPKDKRQEIKVYRADCYICRDAEFRAYGLPLCRQCPKCGGHIAADDCICDDCGYEEAGAPDEKPGQGIKCKECGSWTWSWIANCRNCRAEVIKEDNQ